MSNEERQEEKKDSFIEFIEKAAPYVKIMVQNWKKLLYINAIVVVISAAILLLFVKNYYDATVVILPNYGEGSMGSLSALSGLAAAAGISVGKVEPTEIYQNLVGSETILKSVIYKKYTTKEFAQPVNLIDYFEIVRRKTNESDPVFLQERDKFEQMVEIFRKNILTTEVDFTTHILTITIRLNEQALAADVANAIVVSLDEYVKTKRKSNAVEQRIYIEKRTNQVKDSLITAEEVLKKFREQNRIINISPQLMLEQTRLLRNVEILQIVFVELTKQMEIIRLEEIKDTPIINIREEAGIPIQKAGPMKSVYLFIITMISLVISILWILFNEDMVFYYKTIYDKLVSQV